MIHVLKPLLVGGGLLIAGAAMALKKQPPNIPNPDPFEGQLFTVSDAIDDAFYEMGKETMPNIPPKEALNLGMFAAYSESGLNPQAHVNGPDVKGGKNKMGLTDRASIGPKTIGGGLFGLMRRFAPAYIGDMTFEEWLNEDILGQLPAMRLWLKASKGRIKTPVDIRYWGFAPKYIGAKPGTIVYPEGSAAVSANIWADTNGDGAISSEELAARWVTAWNKHVAYAKAHGGPRQMKAA